MLIELSGSTPPANQIADQLRGLISSGQLAAEDKLPSVRQLARDLSVAPGTVAKAYRALESDGFVTAQPGGSTRVSSTASTTNRRVIEAARALSAQCAKAGVPLDEAVRILRATWGA
ncbi:GntR family transcriptional regulator [Microbacterium sp. B35-04]|uniref:GntR family transcriptional regulator n=1 Tax=Microbacterium sp. B35-04 TaxID=1961716 RepID=UPI0013D0FEE7|nr:GntR family transcriptional regulator [Microbacterium sp. B35-04]KAF2414663.1 GntR family transcriptional regulator [Microbacterium sp. B35-04]